MYSFPLSSLAVSMNLQNFIVLLLNEVIGQKPNTLVKNRRVHCRIRDKRVEEPEMVGDYKGKEYLVYTKEQLHIRTHGGYEHAQDLRADQNLTRIEELGN